ncbi:precorrin-2 C(20)-methyltransferase [Beijerinckia indica]|uniref:Precorrin-2 C20-methyltransferase n=1 Tax=Beijerinckia indica subsp. indica (strain ATCC 9039 / DSM 1715 / NCIMB 8712) TaxID=395963 RepID=B2IFG7_BEII9|nr:precorrin-2 C(20)-methyltransferase [Beijerinckia indica]ACB97067.1 precorrin-2 C20-methyltransferase [Beijerinckia indica subsp. indica ATCC 9039]
MSEPGTNSSCGRLYGLGLGPGDPDLITVKAARLIEKMPVIAYFAKRGASGKARAILEPWLKAHTREVPLLYPLTTEIHFCDPAYAQALRAFYETSAETLATYLAAGQDVALVCEGDPLFYGSFMHLHIRLRERFPVTIVPGISGMAGAWCAAQMPMTWGDDVLSVLPGTLKGDVLTTKLRESDAVVIIKIGANLAKIRASIIEAGRLDEALYIEQATMTGEYFQPLTEKKDENAPYFSMILIPGQGRRP